jgi:hypothetical protein
MPGQGIYSQNASKDNVSYGKARKGDASKDKDNA